MIQLTKEEIDAIEAESKKLYPYMEGDNDISFGYNSMQGGKRIGYTEAATSRQLRIKELEKALVVCHKSLCTYGSHPLIDEQVNQALNYNKP